MPSELTEHEQDAILEIFNMGVGAAGDTLSQMIGTEVLLSLPKIALVERAFLRADTSRDLSAVEQTFNAPFGEGKAVLAFPEVRSLALIDALMGETAGVDSLTGMEEEALTEVGNIILNSCLARLSEIASKEIEVGVPRFQRANCLEGFLGEAEGGDGILLLDVQFDLKDREIEGRLLFLVETLRLRSFVQVVEASLLGG